MGVVTHAHACAILLASTNTVSVNTYTHVIWKYYRLWVSEWVFIAVWELLVVACLACSSRSPWLAKVPQDIQSGLHERWWSTGCGDSLQIHHRGWLEEKKQTTNTTQVSMQKLMMIDNPTSMHTGRYTHIHNSVSNHYNQQLRFALLGHCTHQI